MTLLKVMIMVNRLTSYLWILLKHLTLCHIIDLRHKLQWNGIVGNNYQWISSFLNDCHQKVVIDDASSDSVPVISGVPQGTVLGQYYL